MMRSSGTKSRRFIGAAAIALCASIAVAQDAPESLLPPGFDDPAPTPTPTAAPVAPVAPVTGGDAGSGGSSAPTVQPVPGAGLPPAPDFGSVDLSQLPTLEELEEMSPDELDDLLGLKPTYDIPPAARRSLAQVGLLSPREGGLPVGSLKQQPASLVRAALANSGGPLVSRWGHILVRRTLASRLNTPDGMSPVEFAAMRAKVLNGMGEHAVARALVQDVDTGNYSPEMTNAAVQAYVATGDVVGACPAVRFAQSNREDAQWTMLGAICNAYAGEGALASRQLDRALREQIAPQIDVLLAQRFAGAAGQGRRAVSVEWDNVEDLNPWRFALANAVGEPIPDELIDDAGAYYQRAWAIAPMLPLSQRAMGADLAAQQGIMSANAMVDLYSQIYADTAIGGEVGLAASRLRQAYVGNSGDERLAAMQDIWGGTGSVNYGRYVLTAYAAARLAPDAAYADDAGALIASMLTAGLDRDAMAWSGIAPEGSDGWAMLQLVRPVASAAIGETQIEAFLDDDGSAGQRKSQFFVAGLAGLGRASAANTGAIANDLGFDLSRQTKWSRMISAAAEVDNAALVVMLAGLGMQGESWDNMTPLHLFHITSALNKVGLGAEARLIAAEAVARG
ncbi:MAG: hypothetical protein ABJ239_12775 [Erythrobacter sp.]